MTRQKPAIPNRVKSFYDYFELSADVEQVLEELGYRWQTASLTFPPAAGSLQWVVDLKARFFEVLPHLVINNETAAREFLVAPLLFELIRHANVKIRTEYALNVSERLKGNLDYLLEGKQNLVVIEAKHGDLYRGFRQLAAELVALDKASEPTAPFLYGALTVGSVWQFARLDRSSKTVVQGLTLYRVPDDLEELAKVLTGILNEEDNSKENQVQQGL